MLIPIGAKTEIWGSYPDNGRSLWYGRSSLIDSDDISYGRDGELLNCFKKNEVFLDFRAYPERTMAIFLIFF